MRSGGAFGQTAPISSSLRRFSSSPNSRVSSRDFFTIWKSSFCSSFTWCFTYSASTLTFAS